MDDNAKIVFELVDRSGPGAAATSPNVPGTGEIPGASLAQDFQEKVTSSGAGASLGAGSYTPTPAPAITPTDAVRPTGDPLLSTVQRIAAADPTTRPEELQKALGIDASRAQDLLAAAKRDTKEAVERTRPTPTPAVSGGPLDQFFSTTQTQRDAEDRFGNNEVAKAANAQLRMQAQLAEAEAKADARKPTPAEAPKPSSALPEGPLSQFFTTTTAQRDAEDKFGGTEVAKAAEAQLRMKSQAASAGKSAETRDARLRADNQRKASRESHRAMGEYQDALLNQRRNSRETIDQTAGIVDQLFQSTGASRIPGVGAAGNLISTALRVGPTLAGSGVNALAGTGLGTAASPVIAEVVGGAGLAGAAGPLAAVAAAAAAIPIGASIAAFNEANRAVQVARYSPDLAQAQAEATVRQVMADLRSSQKLGPAAADFTDATSRISAAAQGIRDSVGKPVVEELGAFLRIYAAYVERADKIWNSPIAERALELMGRLSGGTTAEWILQKLGILADEQRKANNMFTWFDKQPTPTLPEPFTDSGKAVPDATFEPIPGLRL